MLLTSGLHYELAGNPSHPAVVFLHGFMGSTQDWGQVMDRLAPCCHCLAVDLPGHGKSTGLADDVSYTFAGAASRVVEVMKRTKVVPATVVGYSMGGRLALHVALHHRYACSGMIMESATAGIRKDSERKQRMALDEGRAKELEQGRFEDFLRTWYCQPIFQTLARAPERLERVVRQRLVNDPLELARAMRGMGVGAQPSFWGKLSQLVLPALLLAGERDRKYVDIVQTMASSLPQGRVAIVAGAGHNAHLEQPVLVADHIKDFVLKE